MNVRRSTHPLKGYEAVVLAKILTQMLRRVRMRLHGIEAASGIEVPSRAVAV